MSCNPDTPVNYARLFYGDGASRSGNVEDPVAVPGNSSQLMWFRGAKSLDSALDLLLELGMSQAEQIVFTGGSAGGLTVFLHLDHVASRMKTEAPNARVVGEPVCGFFAGNRRRKQQCPPFLQQFKLFRLFLLNPLCRADLPNDGYAPPNVTYPLRMQYVYNMQNATGSLSSECQAHFGPDAWKCECVLAAQMRIFRSVYSSSSPSLHTSRNIFLQASWRRTLLPSFRPRGLPCRCVRGGVGKGLY
jgi:hypothetical protein